MTNGFHGRLNDGLSHEQRVADALRENGWAVERFGQALLSEHARGVLRDAGPACLYRWLPDLLIARDGVTWLVDAKSGRTDTAYHALEVAAHQAHVLLEHLGIEIAYIWADLSTITVRDVAAVAKPGPSYQRGGSGAAYVLVPKGACLPFPAVFGRRIEAVA